MRLMSYDVLAKHASAQERDVLIEKYRWPLLTMGVISGMLGAVPTFFWATSALALIFFPIVSFVALWIYSLIFVFAALWFSHFLLDALQTLRQEELDQALTVPARVIDAELPYHG
jgi:Flp pilus assembly protein TadB